MLTKTKFVHKCQLYYIMWGLQHLLQYLVNINIYETN